MDLLVCIVFLGPMKMKLSGVCDCRENFSSNEPGSKEHAKKARKEDAACAAGEKLVGSSARKCAIVLLLCESPRGLPGEGA